MIHPKRLAIGFILAALLISACRPLAQPAPIQNPPAAAELQTAAPVYAERGPHWVGYRALVSGSPAGEEAADQPLSISFWYPALNPDAELEKIEYSVQLKDSAWSPAGAPVTLGRALPDAPVNGADGPYPLVILSHGYILSPAWYSSLAEQIASHGFIVLAPDHIERFDPTFSNMWKALIDRPRDVKRTLDYAETLSGDLAEVLDMANVAVVGHSYGGYTALTLGGAQIDFGAYEERCAPITDDDPLAFFCTPLLAKGLEMAQRAGLDGLPEGLWPSLGDSRVTAVISMAGDAYLFGQAGLSQISVPLLVLTGSADTGTPFEWGAKPTYDHAQSEQKALAVLEGGEHMIFTTPCANQPWLHEHPYADYFCSDPAWERGEALDLIHHFSTAFLLHVLKGDPAAHHALLPSQVRFADVSYATTLK